MDKNAIISVCNRIYDLIEDISFSGASAEKIVEVKQLARAVVMELSKPDETPPTNEAKEG